MRRRVHLGEVHREAAVRGLGRPRVAVVVRDLPRVDEARVDPAAGRNRDADRRRKRVVVADVAVPLAERAAVLARGRKREDRARGIHAAARLQLLRAGDGHRAVRRVPFDRGRDAAEILVLAADDGDILVVGREEDVRSGHAVGDGAARVRGLERDALGARERRDRLAGEKRRPFRAVDRIVERRVREDHVAALRVAVARAEDLERRIGEDGVPAREDDVDELRAVGEHRPRGAGLVEDEAAGRAADHDAPEMVAMAERARAEVFQRPALGRKADFLRVAAVER